MERRNAPRTQRRFEVIVDGDAAVTADVTANGLCVETSHLATPGKSINGIINIGQRAFNFAGIVCWARGVRMGVRFIGIIPGLQDALAE